MLGERLRARASPSSRPHIAANSPAVASTATFAATSLGSSPIQPMSLTIIGTPAARQSPAAADASPEKEARNWTAARPFSTSPGSSRR